MPAHERFDLLNQRIIACERCPRLRAWCQRTATEKRAAFRNETYWGLPAPNFGDPLATGVIVGLAPAAHGANRTGRLFTGDRSGDWLFRALYRAGLANQPESISADDGLTLRKILITAVSHCAPPQNKPTIDEMNLCEVHLVDTLALGKFRAALCLGAIAWNRLHRTLGRRPPKFAHGAESPGMPHVLASYHPSQQNTFTGTLTEPMFDEVVSRFAKLL